MEFSLKVKASLSELLRDQPGQRRIARIPCHRRGGAQGWYEAMNSLFASPEAGMMLVERHWNCSMSDEAT